LSHLPTFKISDEKLYVTCKVEIPMDVEFTLSDTLEVSGLLSTMKLLTI